LEIQRLNTKIIRLDANNLEQDKLQYAAGIIKNGGLVAFPTETVYGLGANTFDKAAVSDIFKAKGRPSDNPLIVHISDKNSINSLVSTLPACAEALMEAFWPGPLTLVMPKSEEVPDIITAGLDTVAIRMPSHPVALALIEKAGVPIAAPSANSSGRPSPTLAEHVIEDLSGKIDVIIDGGKVEVGLESTVLDITGEVPIILRPGGITHEQLVKVLGRVDIDRPAAKSAEECYVPRSPGMKYRHYAPKAKVIIIQGKTENVVKEIKRLQKMYESEGEKTAILATDETKSRYVESREVLSMGSRLKPKTIAANLFESLRHFDATDVQVILAEAIEDEGIGLAVMNRLKKAAANNIIRV
jgi:L-threonylcarbamoyladenylate synthase